MIINYADGPGYEAKYVDEEKRCGRVPPSDHKEELRFKTLKVHYSKRI